MDKFSLLLIVMGLTRWLSHWRDALRSDKMRSVRCFSIQKSELQQFFKHVFRAFCSVTCASCTMGQAVPNGSVQLTDACIAPQQAGVAVPIPSTCVAHHHNSGAGPTVTLP